MAYLTINEARALPVLGGLASRGLVRRARP